MQSVNNRNTTREIVELGFFVTIAAVLAWFEKMLPLAIPMMPWAKLGLANIVTLIVLCRYSYKETMLVIISRILLIGIFVGSGMSFIYSVMGGALSFIAMAAVKKILGDKVSVIGISVLGGISHNIGQIMALMLTTGVVSVGMTYLPMLIIFGVISGIFTGVVAKIFLQYFDKIRRVYGSNER